MLGSVITEFSVAVGTEVRQLMVLPVRPQVIDRVQFRSVGRQKLRPQPPAFCVESREMDSQNMPFQRSVRAFMQIPPYLLQRSVYHAGSAEIHTSGNLSAMKRLVPIPFTAFLRNACFCAFTRFFIDSPFLYLQ